MDGLELDVGHAGLDEDGHDPSSSRCRNFSKRVETLHQAVRRRRDEDGVSGPGATDPVLAAAELARHLVGTPPVAEQHAVDLAQEPEAERKLVAQTLQPVLQAAT